MSENELSQLEEGVRLFTLREYASRKRLEDPRLSPGERARLSGLHAWASRVLARLEARRAWATGQSGSVSL